MSIKTLLFGDGYHESAEWKAHCDQYHNSGQPAQNSGQSAPDDWQNDLRYFTGCADGVCTPSRKQNLTGSQPCQPQKITYQSHDNKGRQHTRETEPIRVNNWPGHETPNNGGYVHTRGGKVVKD